MSLSDGNGSVSSRGPPIAQLTNGSGEIDISSAGVTGGLAGTVTIAPPGATLTGTFQLLVNTTALPSSVTLAGQSTPLPAGPYFEFSAAGATLTVGSQSLTGDFTLQQSTTGGVTTTVATVANATLSIVSGTTTLLAVKNGHGTLTVSPAGVVGSLTATVSTAPAGPLLGLSVTALTIAVNTTSSPASGLPAGPFFGIEAAGATLNVAGQTVTGDFGVEVSSEAGTPVVIASVANATASLGGGIVLLSGGSGVLLVSGSGVAASFSGTLAINVPGVSVSGAARDPAQHDEHERQRDVRGQGEQRHAHPLRRAGGVDDSRPLPAGVGHRADHGGAGPDAHRRLHVHVGVGSGDDHARERVARARQRDDELRQCLERSRVAHARR